MAILFFSTSGYWLFHLWLLVAILLMVIGEYSILMVIGEYFINGYWWLFY
jgi:hypothetical protein